MLYEVITLRENHIREFENRISDLIRMPLEVKENTFEDSIDKKIDSAGLTLREAEVTKLLAKGLETKEICHELSVSVNTAKKHIYNIYRKFNVQNKVELINFFNE